MPGVDQGGPDARRLPVSVGVDAQPVEQDDRCSCPLFLVVQLRAVKARERCHGTLLTGVPSCVLGPDAIASVSTIAGREGPDGADILDSDGLHSDFAFARSDPPMPLISNLVLSFIELGG
jgi:hypothetical protein